MTKPFAAAGKGFTAFVPWSYKRGNTPMEAKVEHVAGASRYFRMLAAARLYLDNVDHIQASWFSEGKKTGQISLQFGADDFGGTLFEENVHLATGHVNKTTVAEIETLIRESGFTPAQRTTLYEILKVGEGMTPKELAERMSATPSDVIKRLIKLGVLAAINTSIDAETIGKVAEQFRGELRSVELKPE